MADEIRINENASVTKSSHKSEWKPGQITHSMPDGYNSGGAPGSVLIGLAEQDIDFGDIVPGVVFIQNNDANNYFRIGPKSGGSMVAEQRVLPGKTIRLYLDEGTILRAIANSAPVWADIRGYPGYPTTTTTTTT